MGVSNVRGLKEEHDVSNDKFVRFFELVQREAGKIGCVFFGFSGEGREFETTEMEGEDLCGWLVDEGEADVFETQWATGVEAIEDRFADDMRFAKWDRSEEGLTIRFVSW